jgi:hypothetical protein
MSSRSAVAMSETSSDPKQPSLLLKKKSISVLSRCHGRRIPINEGAAARTAANSTGSHRGARIAGMYAPDLHVVDVPGPA